MGRAGDDAKSAESVAERLASLQLAMKERGEEIKKLHAEIQALEATSKGDHRAFDVERESLVGRCRFTPS
jgi:hypothetical protein